MTLCKGVEEAETFRVKVKVRKTFAEIIATPLVRCFCCLLFLAIFCSILTAVIVLLRARCYLPPDLELRSVTVHNMTVTAPPNRELNYAINITLATHNPNTIPGCAIKYRQMVVSTAYRGDVLQQSVIPLAFSQIKRGRTREVVATLGGEHVQLNQSTAPFLQSEVDNRDVLMQVFVDTRFRISVGKTKLRHVRCQVIVSTPSPSSQAILGGMLYNKCSVV